MPIAASSSGFTRLYVGTPSERTITWSPSSRVLKRISPRNESSITTSPSFRDGEPDRRAPTRGLELRTLLGAQPAGHVRE